MYTSISNIVNLIYFWNQFIITFHIKITERNINRISTHLILRRWLVKLLEFIRTAVFLETDSNSTNYYCTNTWGIKRRRERGSFPRPIAIECFNRCAITDIIIMKTLYNGVAHQRIYHNWSERTTAPFLAAR